MKMSSTDSSTTIGSWIRKLSFSLLFAGYLGNPASAEVSEVIVKPAVKDDAVTAAIRVRNNDGKPIAGLTKNNFRLMVDRASGKSVDLQELENYILKNPQQKEPPPAWIIMLVDYSGSMTEKDTSGKRKIDGALAAIRESLEILSDRGFDTMVSIVPFGAPGKACDGIPVDRSTLDSFLKANDYKLSNYVDYLSKQTPCAATDIYSPLTKAVEFLESGERFSIPEDSSEQQPRLAIILLSDGFHNRANAESDFNTLLQLLGNTNRQIFVHTLGYGLTQQQLGDKYLGGRRATRADIGKGSGKVPEEEFVDEDKLASIAEATDGIAQFGGDAEAIAEDLKAFLNDLLGAYEISYIHPNAVRGGLYEVQVVINNLTESETSLYRIDTFGYSVPLKFRLIMLGGLLILTLLGGILPFYFWAKSVSQSA